MGNTEIYSAQEDPRWSRPVIDEEEVRYRILPDRTKLPYRYYHVHFEGERLKCILCFPASGAPFRWRFYQYLSPFPGPDEETASTNMDRRGLDDRIAFAILNGSGYVESNMCSRSQFGGAVSDEESRDVYRSSAASAELFRTKAKELYGEGRVYGYVYGGSGGGYKTMSCIENTDSFDGACPYIIGCPVSLPNSIVAKSNADRRLRRVLPQIAKAVDAGGTDPYEGLNEDETKALREITSFGFPMKDWHFYDEMDDGSLPVLIPAARQLHADYFKDFWTEKGYEGSDPEDSAYRDRLCMHTKVVKVLPMSEAEDSEEETLETRNGADTAWKKMMSSSGDVIQVTEAPSEDQYIGGVDIHVESGEAKGTTLKLGAVQGKYLILGAAYGFSDTNEVLSRLKPGDELFLDNSDYIAFQNFYRHQMPEDPDYHAFDQFRKGGENYDPDRKYVGLMGPGFAFSGAGSVQSGNIQGKVIVTACLMDEAAYPWMADWYRQKVINAGHGSDFRLNYYDRCIHGDESGLQSNYITNYLGALFQALLDVADWTENGIEPPLGTVYTMQGGLVVPEKDPEKIHGLQPQIRILYNGEDVTEGCVHIKAGEKLILEAMISAPSGKPVDAKISWSDRGTGSGKRDTVLDYLEEGILTEISDHVSHLSTSHEYGYPGTAFVTVRAMSERNGDKSSVFTKIRNLARVKVVVE